MALKGVAITITYIAWDTVNQAGKTGDVANHTIKLVQDGVIADPTNSPAQVDATNRPGVYKLTLTSGDMAFDVIDVGGKSSTPGVAIFGLVIITESGYLGAVKTKTDNLPGTPAAVGSKMDLVDAPNATALTALAAAIWNALTAGLVTTASIGKKLADWAVGTIDTYTGNTKQTGDVYAKLPANLVDLKIAVTTGIVDAQVKGQDNIDFGTTQKASITAAVWDAAIADHLTPGSTGNTLGAAGSAGDPWNTPLPGSYADGTAGQLIGDSLDVPVSTRSTMGSGRVKETYTVDTGAPDYLPIADVLVIVYATLSRVTPIASGRTNSFGKVIFWLDPGTYYMDRFKDGDDFVNPDIEVVEEP